MLRLVLLILTLTTLLPTLAQAYDILILQSRHDTGYEDVMSGFRQRTSSRRVIVLSDYVDVDAVRIVREDRPKLILAIGDAALKLARKVQNTPIIAVMTLGIGAQSNITGITMFAPPERYCNLLHLMKARRVGVIHNPEKTGWYMRQARQAAEKADIELVVCEVSSSRDTLTHLSSLSGKIDALWMLPDVSAVTRETTEAYFRFGQDQSIPVISFAGSYLGMGAAAVIEINYSGLGRQAGDMATALLAGNSVADVPTGYPRSTTYKTNPVVLKRLGRLFDDVKQLSPH